MSEGEINNKEFLDSAPAKTANITSRAKNPVTELKEGMGGEDGTSAQPTGRTGKEDYSYNPTMSSLLEQYILKYFPVPSLIAIIVFGFMYVQDNNYGRLQTWEGIFWVVYKAGIFLAITVLFYLIPNIINKIFRKK